MKLVILFLTAFAGQMGAYASSDVPEVATEKTCQSRLGAIVNNKLSRVPINNATYKLAARALVHYRDNITQGGVYISSSVVYHTPAQKIAGYSVYITDGGDESTVSYYFDAAGKMIFGKWFNQTPATFWFCE